jgi:hypothetical protein
MDIFVTMWVHLCRFWPCSGSSDSFDLDSRNVVSSCKFEVSRMEHEVCGFRFDGRQYDDMASFKERPKPERIVQSKTVALVV